jgi:CheY-like chemotaxis protein
VFEKDFHVQIETNALHALQTARAFRPDLIFVDIKMPGEDGLSFARQIRQEPWLLHRPIVFFSGLPDADERSLKARSFGPTEFLPKGVPLEVIQSTARRLLADRLLIYEACRALQRAPNLESLRVGR